VIRPERDPHWCLGVEHGRDGLEPYPFRDAENMRRYLLGYERGQLERRALLAAHPYQHTSLGSLGQQLAGMQQLRPGGPWNPRVLHILSEPPPER